MAKLAFEAQKAIEFEMPFAGIDGKWRDLFEQTYFVKLESGGYVRMRFQMIGSGGYVAVVESYYNPSGSRNLEYDSATPLNPILSRQVAAWPEQV